MRNDGASTATTALVISEEDGPPSLQSWEEWSAGLAAAAISDPDAEGGPSIAAPCGVRVPSFLQALLGIDFVPYHLPTKQEAEKLLPDVLDCGKSEDAEVTRPSVDQEVLTVVGLMLHEDERDYSKANTRTIAEDIFRPFEDDVNVEAEIHAVSGSNRKARTPRRMSSLIQNFRRRRVRTPRSGSPALSSSTKVTRRIQSSKSMPCEYDFSHDSTPKRKGYGEAWAAEECSLLESIQTQHISLQVHQERLLKAQKEAVHVKNQACEIEDRMFELQKQILEMKRALDLSSVKLKLETKALKAAKEQISNLDREAEEALRCLEESLKVLRQKSVLKDSSAETLFPCSEGPTQMNRLCASTDNDLSTEETKSRLPDSPPLLLCNNMSTGIEERPPRSRANTAPTRSLSTCSSFMRINDLGGANDFWSDSSSLTSAAAFLALDGDHPSKPSGTFVEEDFFFLDHDISLVLDKLFELGYAVATDESDRFEPTRDTKHLLKNNKTNVMESEWPVQPWHSATGTHVLTWIGGVDHEGFGHDWPVVKARGIVGTSPRALLDFLLDSTQVQRYNKMSQGREDVLVLQEGVDTTADESGYGFAGDAKIVRALLKPKMLPKTIEMLSLWHSKPLPNAPPGSYMIVNRSVWENGNQVVMESTKQNVNMLRSEMLLGVQLLRPVRDGRHCELTTIAHVFSPGVPEIMAKRFAPSNATGMLREIQAIFRQDSTL